MLNLFKLYKGVLTCCRTLAKKKKKRANDGEYLRSISSKWLSNYNIIIFVLIPRYVCLNEQNSTVIHVGKSIETKGHFNWSPCILNKGFLNSKCLLLIHLVVCLVGEVNFVEYKKKNLFCDHKVCHWVKSMPLGNLFQGQTIQLYVPSIVILQKYLMNLLYLWIDLFVGLNN